MMRKAVIIGVLAAGLGAGAVQYNRFVCCAQTVQHYLRDLDSAGTSLSPLERFVLSLVLANTKPETTADASGRT